MQDKINALELEISHLDGVISEVRAKLHHICGRRDRMVAELGRLKFRDFLGRKATRRRTVMLGVGRGCRTVTETGEFAVNEVGNLVVVCAGHVYAVDGWSLAE